MWIRRDFSYCLWFFFFFQVIKYDAPVLLYMSGVQLYKYYYAIFIIIFFLINFMREIRNKFYANNTDNTIGHRDDETPALHRVRKFTTFTLFKIQSRTDSSRTI